MVERQRERRRRMVGIGFVVLTLVIGTAAAVTLAPLFGGLGGGSGGGGGGGTPPKVPMHVHVQLSLYRDDHKATLPGDIGQQGGHWVDHSLDRFLDTREAPIGTMSPLHTHDSSGTVHVEASETRAFTLGQCFAVWGQPVGPAQTVDLVPDATHTLTMTVNGVASDAWGALVLADGDDIQVHYDTV